MTQQQFHQRFLDYFGFTPTESQATAMQSLSDFIYEKGENFLFILKGYAGTGKTSLVSALIKALEDVHVRTVILAPTGRAAKVISQYAGRKAYTIHKWIYRVSARDGLRMFTRRENKHTHTLFIVDEASMISADSSAGEIPGMGSLLDDLVEFVFSNQHNRMLFIGDDAQLPPVQSDESPALTSEYMQHAYDVTVRGSRLTDVVRQSLDSGILYNATLLRNKINESDSSFPLFSGKEFADFARVPGGELEDLLNTLYNNNDCDDIVAVTRSNKRAYLFNNEIRSRILYRENRIATGDYLMAVKNNYYWIDEGSEVGFIANGDIMEVMSIHKQQELYGFTFADVSVRLCDYPNYPDIDIKIILESLEYEGPSLPFEETRKLYEAVAEDYQDEANKRLRHLKIKNDPYLNAVQVKFAYSLTCHKTQGGQWKHVLVDQGYLTEENLDREYMRWLYTAVTRSTENVYLINFDDQMFGREE
ncbi:MAG: AAA family ATPase [Bacteroidales bacterium]|nr:AAA family ATPase [Bacteroidales bacterium]